jgi:hypothetical protein
VFILRYVSLTLSQENILQDSGRAEEGGINEFIIFYTAPAEPS